MTIFDWIVLGLIALGWISPWIAFWWALFVYNPYKNMWEEDDDTL